MPIIYKDFLYLHMPKTGGMWVSKVLLENGGQKIKGNGIHRHTPISKLSEEHLAGKLLFGTLRDPWSWYVSLWRHLQVGADGRELLSFLSGGKNDFSSFLQGVTNADVWRQAPREMTDGWWDWPNGEEGLYTETAKSIYGDHTDTLIDTALLYEGLEIVTGIHTTLDSHPPTNSSVARSGFLDPEDLYGDEEYALIESADGEFAQHVGYYQPFGVLEDSAIPGNWSP